MRIHQFIPFLHAPGDAAADQVYALQRVFRAAGHMSEIYAMESDPEAAGRCHPAQDYQPHRAEASHDVLLYHYVTGSPLTARLRVMPGRLLLFYQNVTPSEIVSPFNRDLARSLQAGREELGTLCHAGAMAPSEYSRSELLALGFQRVAVVPLLLDFERLHASAQTPAGRALVQRYADGAANWLCVGRIAPNKRCEDVLKAWAYYRRCIRADTRLFMVGSDSHFEAYRFNLARLAERWGIEVHWCGRIPYGEGFGAYYEIASVFICMSEHEGFCAPLVEAISFDVPVVAYQAAAVPHTLGGAGVLVNTRRPEPIAELVEVLQRDEALRARVVSRQRGRLKEFAPERVSQAALKALEWLIERDNGAR